MSLEEFSELYCNECKGQVVEECTELASTEFAGFDADNNNEIDQAEWNVIYYYNFAEGGSGYHMSYLFALYDADNDGTFSVEEYSKFSCEVIYTGAVIGDCTQWS